MCHFEVKVLKSVFYLLFVDVGVGGESFISHGWEMINSNSEGILSTLSFIPRWLSFCKKCLHNLILRKSIKNLLKEDRLTFHKKCLHMPNLISQKKKVYWKCFERWKSYFPEKVFAQLGIDRSPAAAAEPPLHIWTTETQSQTVKLHR